MHCDGNAGFYSMTQTLPADPSGRKLSRRAAIQVAFFVQAVGAGGLFPRIPDIQASLQLDEGGLGLLLMAPAIGALLSFLFASSLLERFGTRMMLIAAIPGNGLAAVFLAASPTPSPAFVALFFFGIFFAFSNVAMNVEADRVEAASGARIMNRCHGLWGFGMLVAALIGTMARGIPISPLAQFGLMLPCVSLAVFFVLVPMQAAPERQHSGTRTKRKLVRPSMATLALVGFGSLASLTEGTVRNWSVIFMRDSFSAPEWIDTLTLPAFLLMLSLGRMMGDGWAERFGPLRTAMVMISVAFAGLCMVVASPNLATALTGFGLMGVGICVVYPLTITAAASLGDRPASENVAAFTLINALLMLAAPPLIGLVAENLGIRMSFGMLAPLFLISLVLAPKVLKRA